MAAPGSGGRLVALPLAWLAGVALQLQQRDLWRLDTYLAIAASRRVVVALASARGRGARSRSSSSPRWRGLRAGRKAGVAAPRRDACRPSSKAATSSSPASSPACRSRARAGCAFASRSTPAAPPAGVPAVLALGWYAGFHEDAALVQPRRRCAPASAGASRVRLRQPHGNLNPHGFDYELALFEQGVRATGYVRDAPATLLDASAGHPVERLRQRVRDAIYAHVADRRAAGVLAALAVGDQGAIERDDWDLFRNTGVAHLMSISGLHVTMFAWLAGVADRRGLAAQRARDAAGCRRRARRAGAACVAATAYAFFSGWGVPSQRTVWMLATVTLLQARGLRWPWPLVLLAAAFVVTLLDPWALTQAGLLAVVHGGRPADGVVAGDAARRATPATATRPAGAAGRRASSASMRGGLRTQVIATLGLTPLTLVFFQQVSLVGFLANLVAIPLVTLVITPLALLGIALAPLWSLGALAIVQALDALLGWLAGAGRARSGRSPVAPCVGAARRPARRRAARPAAAWRARAARRCRSRCALLVPPRALPAEGSFDLVAADVGQGTAVLVRTRAHALLFDSRPAVLARERRRPARAACRCCAPRRAAHSTCSCSATATATTSAARARCSARIDGRRAARARSKTAIRCSRPARDAARCVAGQRWRWDGVDFAVLASRRRRLRARAASRTRCRACCASPAAGAACCSPATSSASRRRRWSPPHGDGAAQRRADRAAPRQQDVVDARLPRRRAAARSPSSRPATATASAIRRAEVLGALSRARHRHRRQPGVRRLAVARRRRRRRRRASATPRGATGTTRSAPPPH